MVAYVVRLIVVIGVLVVNERYATTRFGVDDVAQQQIVVRKHDRTAKCFQMRVQLSEPVTEFLQRRQTKARCPKQSKNR